MVYGQSVTVGAQLLIVETTVVVTVDVVSCAMPLLVVEVIFGDVVVDEVAFIG